MMERFRRKQDVVKEVVWLIEQEAGAYQDPITQFLQVRSADAHASAAGLQLVAPLFFFVRQALTSHTRLCVAAVPVRPLRLRLGADAAAGLLRGAAQRLLPVRVGGRLPVGGPPAHLRDVLPHPPQDRHQHARPQARCVPTMPSIKHWTNRLCRLRRQSIKPMTAATFLDPLPNQPPIKA